MRSTASGGTAGPVLVTVSVAVSVARTLTLRRPSGTL